MAYKNDPAEVDGWARSDIQRWDARNRRFQRDQDLYMLRNPDDSARWARNRKDIIILNDPRTLVKKVTRILARHPNVIEVPPSKPELVDPAQRLENWCYAVDQSFALRWIEGLNNPFKYDQAFYITLRGWLCERTLINPDGEYDMDTDPGALFDHQLFDPASIYPYVTGNKIERVTHAYQITAGELLRDPILDKDAESARRKLEDMEAGTKLDVRAVYWKADQDGGWYHCVSTSGEWIKKPTEMGYNPWSITLAQGASYRSDPFTLDGQLDQVGTGILDDSADHQRYLDRAATKLNALLSLEANPPVTYFSADGRPRQISFEPGARNFGQRNDKIEAHRVGPNQGDYKLLWDILIDRQNRAGLPPAFYADYSGESSMAHAVLMAAGRDIMYPFSEALNLSDARRYKKLLTLYRDFGPSKPLTARMQPNSLGVMELAEITDRDIEQQGTYVEVTRTDLTPQEMIQRINVGLQLAKEKIISLRTFRGRDWLGLRNPEQENVQVVSEQVYLDPDVIKALIPAALSSTGQDMIRTVYENIRSGMPQPGSQGDQQLENQNLPAQVLPPAMQTGNPLTNANQPPDNAVYNALLGLVNGGAVGGAGMGGLPPNPATISPTRPMPSPAALLGL